MARRDSTRSSSTGAFTPCHGRSPPTCKSTSHTDRALSAASRALLVYIEASDVGSESLEGDSPPGHLTGSFLALTNAIARRVERITAGFKRR